MSETIDKIEQHLNFQPSINLDNEIINQAFAAIGQVTQKEVENVMVFIKDNIVFALHDNKHLYFRISEDDYRIIGDKYKIIRMNDRRYIFERIQNDLLSSADEVLQLLTKALWEMNGKANARY